AARPAHGADVRRTALKNYAGTPAGRRADIERETAGRVDPERVQRGGELVSAPADVRLRRLDDDRRGRGDEVTRLVVAPGRVALADPHLAREDQGLGARPRRRQAA